MSCASAGNIKISPQNVLWVIEETICVDYKDAVAADLGGTYFNIYDATTTYDVFYDLDAAATPNPGAGTGIEVDVATGDSVAVIQAATTAAIEAATGYVGTADGEQTIYVLDVSSIVTLDAADVDSGLGVQVVHKGGSTDLGLLDGDIEPAFEEQLFDVTAHQTGLNLLAQLRQGNAATIALVLKESTAGLYEDIFNAGGASFTPGGGTELFGWGTSKQGGNTFREARRLVFHPVANAAGDHTDDLTFWLSYPNPDTITYSGENPQLLSVSFTTYIDDTKPDEISRFAFGDSTQTL